MCCELMNCVVLISLRMWYSHGRCGCCIVVDLVRFWILRTHEFVRSVKLCLLWCCRLVVLWSLWNWCKCELVHVSGFSILWIFRNSKLREFVRLLVSIMLCNCGSWDLWILWIIRNCNLWFCELDDSVF